MTKSFELDREAKQEKDGKEGPEAPMNFRGYDLLAATEEERKILEDILLQHGLRDCGL